MKRRHLLAAGSALLASPLGTPFLAARAEETPGETATEIKTGHSIARGGPRRAMA